MEIRALTAQIINGLRGNIFTDIPDAELESPKLSTAFKVVYHSLRTFTLERSAAIVGSAFFLLMLWGYHGNLELLRLIVPGWRGPGVDIGTRTQLISGIPWDHEMISFFGGTILVVLIPMLLIKFVFKQRLSDYGLGLPPRKLWKLSVQIFIILMALCLPAFLIATGNADMRATYPFYRPFNNVGDFILYELTYLPFFIAIEFIFRGYLLFGLAGVRDEEVRKRGTDLGVPGEFFFGKYALLIQMLSYTAWHLGKPLPELWGTLAWGLCAGVMAYTIKSIWPVVAAHWLLNVIFDAIVGFSL